MSDVDRLVRAMAYDRAFAVAGNCTCCECGNPATRAFIGWNVFVCDHLPPEAAILPGDRIPEDLIGAKAVRRLMKIANGES